MNRPRQSVAILAAGATLILSACATAPVTAGASGLALDGLKRFVAAESALDAAIETADGAIDSGRLSLATVARVRAVVDTGHARLIAARAAATAADMSDLSLDTAALTDLIAQLDTLSKG